MDLELCQLDALYLTDLAGYNHIVNQRNKLLKDLFIHPELKDTLDVWDLQMIQYGKKSLKKKKICSGTECGYTGNSRKSYGRLGASGDYL